MNKRIAKGTVPIRVIFAGSIALFCAFSFPFVVNAATAVPQPGESIRDTRPRQQVSLENVDTDNKQASRSVRFTLQEIRVEHEPHLFVQCYANTINEEKLHKNPGELSNYGSHILQSLMEFAFLLALYQYLPQVFDGILL